MKADIAEIKQKEKDFGKLHGQYLDIEHKCKLLQEEQYKSERDSKDRENILLKKIANLEEDANRLNDSLNEKHQHLKETDEELQKYKSAHEDRLKEISRLKTENALATEETFKVYQEKKAVEKELNGLLEAKKLADLEIDRLISLNERLSEANKEVSEAEKEKRKENEDLIRELEEVKSNLADREKECQARDKELDALNEARKANQKEYEKLTALKNKLEEEKTDLIKKLHEQETKIANIDKQYENLNEISESKEERLNELKGLLNASEEKVRNYDAELLRLQKENGQLQTLITRYKEDLASCKKSREADAVRKLELEQEIRRLEREALAKEAETSSVKRELVKVSEHKDKLLDGNYQLSQELEAFKEHSSVLEGQNTVV